MGEEDVIQAMEVAAEDTMEPLGLEVLAEAHPVAALEAEAVLVALAEVASEAEALVGVGDLKRNPIIEQG